MSRWSRSRRALAAARPPRAGTNVLTIRGRAQYVYYMPARNISSGPPDATILFVPGRSGWQGCAIEMATTMASWGYGVFAFDTQRYISPLSEFSRLLETWSNWLAGPRAPGRGES